MIGRAVGAWEFFDKETMEALELPEMCTEIVITAKMDNVVTIDCTYYAPLGDDDRHGKLQERLKQFVLVERSDEPLEGSDSESETDPDCVA